MNTYLLVPRHPHNYRGNPETYPAWEAWFRQLGDAIVDLGNPVLSERSALGDAGTALPLGGYMLINAETIEEATRMASGCPILGDGGSVEVGRLVPVPGREHPARTF